MPESHKYTINLPNGNDQKMTTSDSISFYGTKDCSVTYTQTPTPPAPPPEVFDGLPAQVDKGKTYGPYTPQTTGTVKIQANDDNKQTLCTITVSS